MPDIKFSFCQGCDCKSFDFYDTTGQQPGLVSGYAENIDLSLHTGEVIFRDTAGAVAGRYSVKPSTDGSKAQAILYTADPANTLKDGAYEAQYIVIDPNGGLVGETRQPILISCDLECKIEKLLQSAAASSGRVGQRFIEDFDGASMRLRVAKSLVSIGELVAADVQLKIAAEYV